VFLASASVSALVVVNLENLVRGFGGLGMTKKVVTSDELERLMLAKIKEYSDCQNVKSISFYRKLEGDRSWTISSYDAEIPASVMRKVDLEFARKYDLAGE
jgi:hypothetical protein